MTSNAFSLFDKKQLKSKIHLMSWSPKRDLIAMATDIGELLLYRLSALERAWVLPPHSSGTLINTICWRPDGNVVAVGHSTKEAGVRFVYMEKAEIVWHLNNEKSLLEQPASILKWFEHSEYVTESLVSENISSLSAKDYIPELPKLPSKELQTVNVQSIVGASRFHILILCDVHNNVTLLAYGVFPILTISASTFSLEKSAPVKITDFCLTPDFKEVIFTISLENKPTTASCIAQVVKIPSKYHGITMWDHAAQTACHLTTTLSYMSNVLECMNESCDTVIQEMETKLTCYLINKPISGTIGDELLHFLLWGKSSDVIRDFLMKCITEKGVVKLKKFVESSYTYMLQLLLINFQMAADAIYYHVVEIKASLTQSYFNTN
ncbi:anaphase-promoting complex subunit 4-like [Ciona intestinalis]